ncbi:alpha/beta fold hydrolase ['Paenibacillus yunnanensis' Narsing Rao et al. 2020]|uniref:alpha/beta fold hydrolase n=1 Tax=Paenibacillus tengchongensis TaxID=2608684 RepID=UPI00124DEA18|nr:alpha/beta hydrolase [Paenibacillus tengchongensis]
MKVYKSKAAGQKIRDTYDRLLAEWGIGTEERDIPTRYGSTHVHVFGAPDAAPVVLFHGVGDDSALMWLYNAAALAPHFRLYAVDTLGGPGKSVPGSGYNGQFDQAIWIDEVLDGLGLDRVFAAGVSNGAYLVQHYAAARPERVVKAVAMASSVPAGSGLVPMSKMLRIFLPEALFPTKRNIRKLLTKLSGDNSAVFTDNPLILEHYTYLLRGFNNMAMRYHKVTALTPSEIDSLRSKVLFLIGEDDPFAALGGMEALKAYGMNFRSFPGAGHGINHEIPGEINAAIIQYFKGQS